MDPLSWILDTSQYVPRGSCGDWPAAMRSVWVAGNLLVASAYFVIPFYLWAFRRESRGVLQDRRGLVAQFAAFILLCGLTHLTEVAVFWWPAYRLYAVIYLAAGLVSLRVALVLRPALREYLKRPTREQWHDLLAEANGKNLLLLAANREAEAAYDELVARISRYEAEFSRRAWREDNGEVVRQMLADMRRVAEAHRPRNGNGGLSHA
jgi:hypothetical protein